jgi:hypothetical protein
MRGKCGNYDNTSTATAHMNAGWYKASYTIDHHQPTTLAAASPQYETSIDWVWNNRVHDNTVRLTELIDAGMPTHKALVPVTFRSLVL